MELVRTLCSPPDERFISNVILIGQIDCRRWSDVESGGDENESTTDEIT